MPGEGVGGSKDFSDSRGQSDYSVPPPGADHQAPLATNKVPEAFDQGPGGAQLRSMISDVGRTILPYKQDDQVGGQPSAAQSDHGDGGSGPGPALIPGQ